jgi:hypothetical protein
MSSSRVQEPSFVSFDTCPLKLRTYQKVGSVVDYNYAGDCGQQAKSSESGYVNEVFQQNIFLFLTELK